MCVVGECVWTGGSTVIHQLSKIDGLILRAWRVLPLYFSPSFLNLILSQAHSLPIMAMVYSAQNDEVWTSSDDKETHIWKASTAQLLSSFRSHTSLPRSLDECDGEVIVSGSWDGECLIWHGKSNSLVCRASLHTCKIRSVKLTSPFEMLTSSEDGEVAVWELRHESPSE